MPLLVCSIFSNISNLACKLLVPPSLHLCRESAAATPEVEREAQITQNYWMEIRHIVRCIYRDNMTLESKSSSGYSSILLHTPVYCSNLWHTPVYPSNCFVTSVWYSVWNKGIGRARLEIRNFLDNCNNLFCVYMWNFLVHGLF